MAGINVIADLTTGVASWSPNIPVTQQEIIDYNAIQFFSNAQQRLVNRSLGWTPTGSAEYPGLWMRCMPGNTDLRTQAPCTQAGASNYCGDVECERERLCGRMRGGEW